MYLWRHPGHYCSRSDLCRETPQLRFSCCADTGINPNLLDSDILFFCRDDSDCWISFHLCISVYSHPYNTAFSLPMKRNLLKRLPIISQKTGYSYIVIIYQKPGKKAKPFPRPTKRQMRIKKRPQPFIFKDISHFRCSLFQRSAVCRGSSASLPFPGTPRYCGRTG